MLGDPAGLDRDEGRIGRARGVDHLERRVDRGERQPPVQEQDFDQGPGAAGVAELPARPCPELLVRPRERARLAGLGGRERTRHRARLAHEDLEVVVEEQGLAAPDDAPLVASDDRARVGELDLGAADPRRQRPPGVPRRDRVEALADADPGLGIDLDRDDPGGVEGLLGQRSEG
jgi:hypothetical protein